MQVLLIRHAEAVDETLALRDPHRHLTARGRDQARRLGARLEARGVVPTQVWTSPLVRALQTAELVARELARSPAVEVLPALAPDGSQPEVVAALRALPATSCVLLVGHEPSMSAIGCLLVGTADFAALPKAGAAEIVDGAERGRLAGSEPQ